jgi:hypothetical protein
MLMNRNELIFRIVLIRPYGNSFFISLHYCINVIRILLTEGDFRGPFELELLGIGIVNVSFMLVLVPAFKPGLLLDLNLKS